jgi:hypothetical protein
METAWMTVWNAGYSLPSGRKTGSLMLMAMASVTAAQEDSASVVAPQAQ